ncbi:MAG: GTPase HflX, partial [Tissierellia bacterium]|nr:GTPase HflX [Tissierellia bacterium]
MGQENNRERVLIIGVDLESDLIDIENSLDELEELVKAANGIVISRLVQKKDYINPTFFI